MTTPFAPPAPPPVAVGASGAAPPLAHPEIAQDLVSRVTDAEETWRAPAHQRGAVDDVGPAAQDAQALRRIIERLGGWPGRSLVGDAGCEAALVIALNSDHDLNFQIALLRSLHAAMRQGDATTAQWARLYDRCLVRSGQPQQYGTQYRLHEGQIEMCPVTDPEALDTLRARAGLPPHQDRRAAPPGRWRTGRSAADTGPRSRPLAERPRAPESPRRTLGGRPVPDRRSGRGQRGPAGRQRERTSPRSGSPRRSAERRGTA